MNLQERPRLQLPIAGTAIFLIKVIKDPRKSLAGAAIEESKPNWELKRIRIRTD